MSKKVRMGISILEYLKKIYPKSATEKEIIQETGAAGCACGGVLSTLRSRGQVEVVGKKGRANLYRYRPS